MARKPRNIAAIRARTCAEILAKYLPLGAKSARRLSHLSSAVTKPPVAKPTVPRIFDDDINKTIQCAWKGSTAKKYSSSVEQFMDFCDSKQVPPGLRLPASEYLLSAFASSFAGRLAGRTVRNKMSAIRAWHVQEDLPYLGGKRLAYVLKGVSTLAPLNSVKASRPPMTCSKLLVLANALDANSSLDSAVLFAALTAFWGQIRLGEFFSSTERSYDPTLAPAIGNLGTPNNNGSRTIHLPNTKTGGPAGEDIILCRQRPALDPIAALRQHLLINKGNQDDVLCGYINGKGIRVPLTRRRFLRRCNQVWLAHGLATSTGHEFRIGGTTYFLLARIPPDVVKALGRWSSDSFLRYWRSVSALGTMYTEYLPLPV